MINPTDTIFNQQEKLIYDLIFSDKLIFFIDLNFYCKYKARSYFRENIRTILRRSGVKVTYDRIVHTNNTDFWKLDLEK